MPPRIMKRKSNGKSNRNFQLESKSEDSRIEVIGSSRKLDAKFPTPKRENTVQDGSTVPNRVFVGGIPTCVNEGDIRSRFLGYGNVRAVKIVRDHEGISKGYGFVTFSSADEAKRAIEEAEVIFKGRKVNIAPAVKKQNYHSEVSENFWNSSDSSIAEQETTMKNYMIYSQFSDQSGFIRYEAAAANAFENPGSYFQGGMNIGGFNTTDLQCGYSGTPQMNILPYPTLVYVPQQAFQCPGAVPYPMNGTFQEVVQFLPAPLCCINESK